MVIDSGTLVTKMNRDVYVLLQITTDLLFGTLDRTKSYSPVTLVVTVTGQHRGSGKKISGLTPLLEIVYVVIRSGCRLSKQLSL